MRLSVKVSVCALGIGSMASAQAIVPIGGTMLQGGGYQYDLGAGAVALGSSSAPSSEPTPGSFGPYTDSYAFGGAYWQTSISSAWAVSNTATTTNVSGQVTLQGLVDATGASASATNNSTAQISFIFSNAQPIAFTANWYSPVGGPFFGTPGYQVLGDFSPYPAGTMSALTPMSNSGMLAAGTHGITLIVDLSVFAPASGFTNDVVGLAFNLEARVVPAPACSATLVLGVIGLGSRRRR